MGAAPRERLTGKAARQWKTRAERKDREQEVPTESKAWRGAGKALMVQGRCRSSPVPDQSLLQNARETTALHTPGMSQAVLTLLWKEETD